MKVTIFEVCRRPEITKRDTEALVLSRCFKQLGITFDLYTNDRIWARRRKAGTTVDRPTIRARLRDPQVDVAHFAVHGCPEGLILEWDGPIDRRVPADTLTGAEIRTLKGLRGKLVVSGACETAALASDFLAAGATAFVAPEVEVPWANLGVFFEAFYAALVSGGSAKAALAGAVKNHRELKSYRVYT